MIFKIIYDPYIYKSLTNAHTFINNGSHYKQKLVQQETYLQIFSKDKLNVSKYHLSFKCLNET